MFRLRREAAIALALAAVVACALLFGSVAHSLVPHSHEGGEAIWQELHAAVRHEKAIAFSVAISVLLTVPLVVRTVRTLQLAPQAADVLLRRGVHKYRKFR